MIENSASETSQKKSVLCAGPVGILGFGVEGKSTLDYLVRKGFREIVVMDKNPVTLPELPQDVRVKTFSG